MSERTVVTMKPPTCLRSPKVSTWRSAASGSLNGRHSIEKKRPPAFRHHLLGEPAVIGPAQLDLHFLLRMQADIEHAGREQAGIIDAHRVHPAMAELHVADAGRRSVFSRAAHRIARHAAAHVLIADRHRHDAGALLLAAAGHGELAQHVVFHDTAGTRRSSRSRNDGRRRRRSACRRSCAGAPACARARAAAWC